jgi:phosphoribosylanthranilate isomerase
LWYYFWVNLCDFVFHPTMRTRIKLCGFTQPEDAVVAADLGVDAIGLVFYPQSPRHVGIEQAQAIVKAVPAFVTVVALFVDAEEAYIRHVLASVAVDCLQFHGDEPPEFCTLFNKSYIKAIRVQTGSDIPALAKRHQDASGLLLDAYSADSKGGTGHRFDWSLVPATCRLPLILAGGLDESNVALAVTQLGPYAVDASSGVETQKGIKNKEKMAAFVRAVNQGDKNKHDS